MKENFMKELSNSHCYICHIDYPDGILHACAYEFSKLPCQKCETQFFQKKNPNYCPNCGHKL